MDKIEIRHMNQKRKPVFEKETNFQLKQDLFSFQQQVEKELQMCRLPQQGVEHMLKCVELQSSLATETAICY